MIWKIGRVGVLAGSSMYRDKFWAIMVLVLNFGFGPKDWYHLFFFHPQLLYLIRVSFASGYSTVTIALLPNLLPFARNLLSETKLYLLEGN